MIYIYKDKGVSEISCVSLEQGIKELFPKIEVRMILAPEVIENTWRTNARAFVMPGGADVYYNRELNPRGIHNIQTYVKEGGRYLGVCAGAYFAANSIEFSKDTVWQIMEKRDLGFFPGLARGPLFSPYFYNSHQGATLASLKSGLKTEKIIYAYHNGGCYFVSAEKKSNVRILYRYKDSKNSSTRSAIILCQVEKGKAVLSGVHPEYTWEVIMRALEKKEPGYQVLQGMQSALKKMKPYSILKRLFQCLEIF